MQVVWDNNQDWKPNKIEIHGIKKLLQSVGYKVQKIPSKLKLISSETSFVKIIISLKMSRRSDLVKRADNPRKEELHVPEPSYVEA